MAQTIVGRTNEITAIERFLADPITEPSALLIEGEAGIGKTTLFNELLRIAAEGGQTVLRCRPARSEMDLSYVGMMELLGDLDEEVLHALPAPQARVMNLILRREEPEGPFDRLSLSVALLAAMGAEGSKGPMVLAIDDVQWLDQPTARTIGYVVRRLSRLPARIALVRRAETDHGWPFELEQALPDDRLTRLRLGPVGPSELSRMLRRKLGWAPAWPRVLRIAELSGGNPFYAFELTRALSGARSDEDVERLLPGSVTELVRSRLAKLPPRVLEAVELASVPRSPSVDLLRRLAPSALDLRDALATAERAGVLTLDGEQVRFAHPILAAAAYGAVPDARKQELHRAVALLSDDLEERARHLAMAAEGPDPEVAAALEGAAEQAWRRGAPDAAADLLRTACRLTPPADRDALAFRRVALGRIMHQAGDVPGAAVELESLVDALPPGPVRARALYHLMYVTRSTGSLGRAVEFGLQAAAEAEQDPSFQSEVFELVSRMADNDIALKLDTARRALEAIGKVTDPDPEVRFYANAALVEAEFLAGLGIHLDRLERFPSSIRPRFPPVRTAARADDLIGRLLLFSGRVDEGLAVLRGLYDRASVENRSLLSGVLGWMAEGELLAGRFAAAAALTEEAIERAAETGSPGGTPWELGFHGVALARLGRLDEAEAAGGRAVEMAEDDPTVGLDQSPGRLALGLVAMVRGRFDDAVDHLGTLDRMKREAGILEPRSVSHAGELVEALVGSGDLAGAGESLDRLEQDAERSGGAWSRAVAWRCRALLLGARGEIDAALEAADRSVEEFEPLSAPFERARALLVKGQLHRRRKEKLVARGLLQEALDAFEALETPTWAERARSELARISGRRSTTALTPTEETVARLAASGLTNREIADRAFLSPKTVEVNLTRVYRKLDVRSRAALRDRLGAIEDGGET
jgi:DNA-binding CsgD family transcriptional regulator/KaiC/GvpD/RAD55 family RecA-like ATPase